MPSRRPALAALLLPLALTACAGSEPAAAPTPSGAVASPDAAPTAGPASPSTAVQQVEVTVARGRATGDTGRVDVAQGATVRLTVVADVADEVHVHGFDLTQDTTPGQPAVVTFVADRTGVFEVELERSRVPLTRLQVR